MAAKDNPPTGQIVPKIQEGLLGHSFYYEFTLDDLGVKELWTFEEEFKTECYKRPSSWLWKMTFQKVLGDGQTFIPVTLRRTDHACNDVHVHVQLNIDHEAQRSFYMVTPLIEKYGVSGDAVMEETMVEKFLHPYERYCFNRRIYIKLLIKVNRCH